MGDIRQQVTDMQMPRPAQQPPQQPPQSPMPPKEHHYMTLVWGLVVLIIVIVGALWLLGGTAEKTYDKDGNEIVNARSGEFIAGFPMEIIPEEGITPETSYVINYESEGRRLFQAHYISELMYDDVVSLYKTALDEAGWTFTRYPGSEAPVTSIAAMKDGAEILVTIVFKPNADVSVEIAYLSPSTNPEAIAEEVATSESEEGEMMEDETMVEDSATVEEGAAEEGAL